MAFALVQQSAPSTSATVALSGVAATNTLILVDAYYRGTTTGLGEAVPTEANGTWLAASNDAPPLIAGGVGDIGLGVFYIANCNAGTHTVTTQANTSHRALLFEISGVLSSSFDLATSAKTEQQAHTSRDTGTTGTTNQADEVVIIGLVLGAGIGSADVGFTNPVSGFTTLSINSNDSSGLGFFVAYKVVAAASTQTATFNWTDNEGGQSSHAAIATFKLSGAAPSGVPKTTKLTLLGVG